MPTFRMPLSRDAPQSSNPLTWHFNPVATQADKLAIELGKSSAPEVEGVILADVASYGRQLGRIEEALVVLLDHFRPQGPLSVAEQKAIAELRTLLDEVAETKTRSFAKNARYLERV